MICTIIIIALHFMAIGIALAKDGEPKGDYSFFMQLITSIIDMFLYWGAGLFDKFGI